MNTINVLWTGGLDSTYLIVKLATTTTAKIQPYYILDEGRASVKKELNAIRQITSELRNCDKVTAQLLDIKVVEKSSIMKDESITNAWNCLHKECKLGSQYDFLARFAKQNGNIKLFVGVMFHERDRITKAILGKVNLVENIVEKFPYLYVEQMENGDSNSFALYENILFPVCMRGIEKVEEWKELNENGFSKVANLTWFCHTPAFGMPCGHCNPCKDALAEGMAFRVPVAGRCLYYIWKAYKKLFRR